MALGKVNSSVVFRLGVLGAMATDLFAARIEPHGLKPKHVGLMVVLDAGTASSQLEVAGVMGVAPSLVVALADHLQKLGAIERVRDPADRRRQVLTLTEHGRELLAVCGELAQSTDAAFTAELTASESAVLTGLLDRLAAQQGLPSAADDRK
ncbi:MULTISPECIES: MarR family winged helix-turn-helix transcriptional regulator [Streptomyces]|uniref:MarR family winged helix-turn-helix transcriptional regulator n=1 Tax=Streptomyces TaxID=1883 RepID=UPI0027DC260A|nr:MarR family winged helix-turn-helix transcriptional regulator [Streptomyces sp. 9-7]